MEQFRTTKYIAIKSRLVSTMEWQCKLIKSDMDLTNLSNNLATINSCPFPILSRFIRDGRKQ